MKAKLSLWRSRLLSFGGKITLINSVLASLPLYFFSFFKAPKVVLKEIVRLQRNFLWGGSEDSRKINWVRWDTICLPKAQGGLGIKDMQLFNLSLLGKWKWRALNEPSNEWSNLLNWLYGEEGILTNKNQSLWWKDLQSINIELEPAANWFTNSIKPRLGNGEKLKFWTDNWCCQDKLKDLYPSIYILAEDKSAVVRDYGLWDNNKWQWKPRWSRILEEREQEEEALMMNTLLPINPDYLEEDLWIWTLDKTHIYRPKSAYELLLNLCRNPILVGEESKTIMQVWNSCAPSKFKAHSWRVLIDRLPTKLALLHRGVDLQSGGADCVWCCDCVEDTKHLFFECKVAKQIWSEMSRWCGRLLIEESDAWKHLNLYSIKTKEGKGKRMRNIVWIAAVWVLWNSRNKAIFKEESITVSAMVYQIKWLTWSWFAYKGKNCSTISFTDWCDNISDCLNM